MGAHREDEVSRPPVAGLRSTQNPIAISSLNEAWLHTLDEYVADTPLSQVILPLMRACFFGGDLRGSVGAKGSWQSGRCRYHWLYH